mgnify:CR=1 FL=1
MHKDILIGRKEILPVIEQMYGITTWIGALKFINRNKLPLRRTPSGKPMIIMAELIKYNARYQEIMRSP